MAEAKLDIEGLVNSTFGEYFGVTLDRLRELAEADKDGRCAVLPCKVGDTVYCIDKQNKIVTEIVGYFYIDENNISMINDREDSDYDFGKTAFLTREAAEAALKAGDTP